MPPATNGEHAMTDTALVVPTTGALAGLSTAAKRLVRDSMSANTLRAYGSALRKLDRWLDGRTLDDAALADYLGTLDDEGLSPSSAATAVAAVRRRARLTHRPDPVGAATAHALEGFHRAGGTERGRGQAPALDLDAISEIAACTKPLDRAIVLVLFQGCLRRSEAAALEWRDIEPAATPGALRIRVRISKTNQTGKPDVRLVKNGAARALLAIRPDDAAPTDRVFGLGGQSIGRRFAAAAKRAGYPMATAHSARATFASVLTERGASTHEIMRAGAWKTARMVDHYAAGVSVEQGAVAKYL